MVFNLKRFLQWGTIKWTIKELNWISSYKHTSSSIPIELITVLFNMPFSPRCGKNENLGRLVGILLKKQISKLKKVYV